MPADTKFSAPISRLNTRKQTAGSRVKKPRGRPFGGENPGKPFKPGQGGRPKGARNKSTVMLESMFKGEAEEIGRRAIERAKDGAIGAIKLVLDRACPPPDGRTVEGLQLPEIATAADAVAAMGAIARAVSAGIVTIGEARDLSTLVDNFRKIHELADIERRIIVLEREKANAQAREQG